MSQHFPTGDQDSIGNLVADIVHDGQKLVRQEIALARAELQQEWTKAKDVSIIFAAGGTLAGVGGLFVALGLVHLLNAVTGLPLWACYGIFAVFMLAGGIFLLLKGKAAATEVDFVPRQTMATVKENVQWFKNRT